MIYMILGSLLGIALGQRFKVLILLPAIAFTVLLAALVGFTRHEGIWHFAFVAITVATFIQIGYLVGSAISDLPTDSTGGSDARWIPRHLTFAQLLWLSC
jgi:hypothetical protein